MFFVMSKPAQVRACPTASTTKRSYPRMPAALPSHCQQVAIDVALDSYDCHRSLGR
jgi:hypothetical protein